MIKNLTPHAIHIVSLTSTDVIRTIEPSGPPARVTENLVSIGEFDEIPLTVPTYGHVVGLPDPEPGVLLIVSMLVKAAQPHRADLVSPGELVRDQEGRIIGCRSLLRSPESFRTRLS